MKLKEKKNPSMKMKEKQKEKQKQKQKQKEKEVPVPYSSSDKQDIGEKEYIRVPINPSLISFSSYTFLAPTRRGRVSDL